MSRALPSWEREKTAFLSSWTGGQSALGPPGNWIVGCQRAPCKRSGSSPVGGEWHPDSLPRSARHSLTWPWGLLWPRATFPATHMLLISLAPQAHFLPRVFAHGPYLCLGNCPQIPVRWLLLWPVLRCHILGPMTPPCPKWPCLPPITLDHHMLLPVLYGTYHDLNHLLDLIVTILPIALECQLHENWLCHPCPLQ